MYQFADHSIPLFRNIILFTIGLIFLQTKYVIESQHQRQFMYQINAETFKPIIARQFGG